MSRIAAKLVAKATVAHTTLVVGNRLPLPRRSADFSAVAQLCLLAGKLPTAFPAIACDSRQQECLADSTIPLTTVQLARIQQRLFNQKAD